MSTPNDPFNTTVLYDRAPGVPFHFRTTWEQTDPGHAQYSFWGALRGFACSKAIADQVLQSDPPCGFRVVITLHKGVVPLEAAHPDPWKGSTSFVVVPDETVALDGDCKASQLMSGWLGCPLYYETGVIAVHTEDAFNATWSVHRRVPFETSWIEARLRADRALLMADAAHPWTLYVHDARTSTFGGCDPDRQQPLFASETVPPQEADSGRRAWTWRLPLAPGMADAPYAPASQWCFFVGPSDQTAAVLDYKQGAGGNNPLWQPVRLTLNVTAFQGPMPK